MANVGVFSGESYEYLHTSRFDEDYDEYALFGYSNSEVLSSKVLSRDNGYVGYVDFIIVRRISERFLYISVRKVELKSSKGDFKYVLTTDDKVEVRIEDIWECRPKHQIQEFSILQRLDTNHDGIINVADFLVFVEHFGRIVDW